MAVVVVEQDPELGARPRPGHGVGVGAAEGADGGAAVGAAEPEHGEQRGAQRAGPELQAPRRSAARSAAAVARRWGSSGRPCRRGRVGRGSPGCHGGGDASGSAGRRCRRLLAGPRPLGSVSSRGRRSGSLSVSAGRRPVRASRSGTPAGLAEPRDVTSSEPPPARVAVGEPAGPGPPESGPPSGATRRIARHRVVMGRPSSGPCVVRAAVVRAVSVRRGRCRPGRRRRAAVVRAVVVRAAVCPGRGPSSGSSVVGLRRVEEFLGDVVGDRQVVVAVGAAVQQPQIDRGPAPARAAPRSRRPSTDPTLRRRSRPALERRRRDLRSRSIP